MPADDLTFTATVRVRASVAAVLEAAQITEDEWAALDPETQWAVLQEPAVHEAAFGVALGDVGRRIAQEADGHTQSSCLMPDTLKPPKWGSDGGFHIYRQADARKRAQAFLGASKHADEFRPVQWPSWLDGGAS